MNVRVYDLREGNQVEMQKASECRILADGAAVTRGANSSPSSFPPCHHLCAPCWKLRPRAETVGASGAWRELTTPARPRFTQGRAVRPRACLPYCSLAGIIDGLGILVQPR